MMRMVAVLWTCALVTLAFACTAGRDGAGTGRRHVPAGAPSASTRPAAARASSRESIAASDRATFRRIFGLSGASEAFLSDNLVSNETSYLDAAPALASRRGGAYLGVGPEQNYSYIAQTRPKLAIIVDLRRENALLHLLYKALFERSTNRETFLASLLGRPLADSSALGTHADARAVIEAVEQHPPDRTWFMAERERLVAHIRDYRLDLTDQDFGQIRRVHERFHERQLDLRFELLEPNGRRYPTLRRLLEARGDGGWGSFLRSEDDFRFVQALERQDGVIPVVCDVSHAEPLGEIAAELRRRNLVVRSFYISNVEQYLLGTPAFAGWLHALGELPTDPTSVLIRSYLDQGRPHPSQRAGQRTTTLVHSIPRFMTRASEHPYRSYYAIAADRELLALPSAAQN